MKKLLLILPVLILLSICTHRAFAQQTNSNEDYSAYLPEVKAFNQQLAHTEMPPPDSNTNTIIKPFVKYIQGPSGNFALRIFKPETIRAIVLDIHGGGWLAGVAAFDDSLNDEMARKCKVAIVSVDYHLAPPLTACINDCNAAAKWLVNNALKEFGTDKLFISGGSAGGLLVALATLYIRDSLHAIEKVKGVNFLYGCFDLSRTPSCRLATDNTLFINKKALDGVWESIFHGWSGERLRNPQYSPLYADLHNLPPAFFTIGTFDPLIDDTYFMEARWRLAGNKTYLAVYPECPHAFNAFPTRMATVANEKIYQWIIELCKK